MFFSSSQELEVLAELQRVSEAVDGVLVDRNHGDCDDDELFHEDPSLGISLLRGSLLRGCRIGFFCGITFHYSLLNTPTAG
jgi:hypothetical protein